MGFPKQEYWSELPFPPPGDLLDLRIEPAFPVCAALQVESLRAEPSGKLHVSISICLDIDLYLYLYICLYLYHIWR